MQAFIDALLAFLVQYIAPQMPSQTQFIFGDPMTSAISQLPTVFVVPMFDAVKPYSGGADMDTYIVPIIVLDDLNAYGPPVANVNVDGALEQPGQRALTQSCELIRDALRAGGAGITVKGVAATSTIPSISYAWLKIDNKVYRAGRIAFQVQQRRMRAAQP